MRLRVLAVLFVCGAPALGGDSLTKCGNKLSCFETETIAMIDRLDQNSTLSIFGDAVVLRRTENQVLNQRTGEESLLDRCIRFLTEHRLQIQIPAHDRNRPADEARTRKLKKIILPLLLLLKLKAGVVVPALLSIVGLIAFKGLAVSLIALTVAGVVGLKSLVEGHHHHNSRLAYEIVPQVASPYWSRAGVDSLQSGYHTIA